MTSFSAELEAYQGPLDVLLGLIQCEELEITSISLAKVTDQFLLHIEQNALPSSQISAFLMVAAELILIKSKVLLPQLEPIEEELEAHELERRLKLYQVLKSTAQGLQEYSLNGVHVVSRDHVVSTPATFRPPEGIDAAGLLEVIQGIGTQIEEDPELQITTRSYTHIPLEQRIEQIHHSVQRRLSLKFSSVLKTSSSKHEVIVSFLAILELLKQQVVRVRQEALHADILIERHE